MLVTRIGICHILRPIIKRVAIEIARCRLQQVREMRPLPYIRQSIAICVWNDFDVEIFCRRPITKQCDVL